MNTNEQLLRLLEERSRLKTENIIVIIGITLLSNVDCSNKLLPSVCASQQLSGEFKEHTQKQAGKQVPYYTNTWMVRALVLFRE